MEGQDGILRAHWVLLKLEAWGVQSGFAFAVFLSGVLLKVGIPSTLVAGAANLPTEPGEGFGLCLGGAAPLNP